MKVDWSFNFHDLVTLRIRERQGIVDRFLARPGRGYVYHAAPAAPAGPDIDVRIGPFAFQDREAVLVDRRFRVGREYFACEDTSKILWWKVEMDGLGGDGPTAVRIDKNLFGTAALGSRIIDCLVRYHLNLRAAPAVHGCGVAGAGGAVLFVGSSGVGKSSIAMRMLERGVPLFGDNWIILKAGEALGFHLPINIHDYNVPPNLYGRLPRAFRLDIQFKKWCRKCSGGYLKKSCPVVLREMFPQLAAERARIRRIVSLIQGDDYARRDIAREQVLDRMLATDMMDREAFHRYMLAFASAYPDSLVATHWMRLRANLDAAVPADAEFTEVTVPRGITSDVLDQINRLVE